ncbi:MAG: hypothetical protein IKU82_02910, partial [Clostridia bacterium]|nr:hypothetical protein [Clostridia bacterium]
MKLCKKCGAHNADDRIFCVDCGEPLGAKLTPEQENKQNEALSQQLEKMYNRRNPLYVSCFDKIVGSIAIAGAIGALIGVIFALINGQE